MPQANKHVSWNTSGKEECQHAPLCSRINVKNESNQREKPAAGYVCNQPYRQQIHKQLHFQNI